jgi:hypothetical protein
VTWRPFFFSLKPDLRVSAGGSPVRAAAAGCGLGMGGWAASLGLAGSVVGGRRGWSTGGCSPGRQLRGLECHRCLDCQPTARLDVSRVGMAPSTEVRAHEGPQIAGVPDYGPS